MLSGLVNLWLIVIFRVRAVVQCSKKQSNVGIRRHYD